jgi:hypothetical protein
MLGAYFRLDFRRFKVSRANHALGCSRWVLCTSAYSFAAAPCDTQDVRRPQSANVWREMLTCDRPNLFSLLSATLDGEFVIVC